MSGIYAREYILGSPSIFIPLIIVIFCYWPVACKLVGVFGDRLPLVTWS
jgi:hypothetical protein